MGIRTFTLLLLLSGGGLALAQDEVTLTDGRVLKGRVVDEGHQIRLVKDLGSIPISKRDIVKVRIDRERLPEGDLVDRVVLNNGSEIAGTIRLERDGRVVVVTGKFGEVKYARSEIREIVYAKGEDGSLDKTKEGAARRVDELLDAMTDPAREEEARAQIIRLGVYAIPHLERALPQAEGANRETIDHLLRVNRLRTVLTREIEETVSEVKDRLLDGDPEVRFAALQDIVLYHLKDSAPVLIYLLENGETDSKIRGYVIDRLAKQRRNSDLIELLQTGDSNIRLAAALALGENGIFLGVPILILALGVDDEAVRVAVFEKLKRFTGEDLLYWPKDPAGDSTDVLHADALAQAKSDREEAIARWEEWWDQNGEGLIRVSMKEFRRSVVSSKEKEEAEKFFSQGANIVERISEDGKAPEEEEIHRGIFLFRSALESDPGLGKARLHLAILYYLRGERSDLLEATSQLRAIVDRYGVESGKAVLKLAHYYIGRIESDRQNWENARIHFDKSIEVDPNFVDGFLSLGQAVYHRAVFEDRLQKELRRRLLRAAVRRFGEAQEAIGRNYEELKDASKGLDLIRGRLVYKGGSFRTHLREYNSVLWAKTAGIHYWLGKALIALGEEPEALESFRRATKLAPDVAIYREAEAMLGQRVDQPSDEK